MSGLFLVPAIVASLGLLAEFCTRGLFEYLILSRFLGEYCPTPGICAALWTAPPLKSILSVLPHKLSLHSFSESGLDFFLIPGKSLTQMSYFPTPGTLEGLNIMLQFLLWHSLMQKRIANTGYC